MGILLEDIFRDIMISEEAADLTPRQQRQILALQDWWARRIYGDNYQPESGETYNKLFTDLYFNNTDIKLKNNLSINSGMFSIGNKKLSNDTLIINFTSALQCPSMNFCPITQKACYAVAGEVRLKDSRRKHILVGNAVRAAMKKKMMAGFFAIAQRYVRLRNGKKMQNKIKYIRYNEDGDFPTQEILEMAARFSFKMNQKYDVRSFAYTSNRNLHPEKTISMQDGSQLAIDKVISFNLSRTDIPHSEDGVFKKFYGVDMPESGFGKVPMSKLQNTYCDVQTVKVGEETLKILPAEGDDFSTPILASGKFGEKAGQTGYYYICPCSFWGYKKTQTADNFIGEDRYAEIRSVYSQRLAEAEENNKNAKRKKDLISTNNIEFLSKITTYPVDANHRVKALNAALEELYGKNFKEELKRRLNKIYSPCGVCCRVCHNMDGGKTESGEEVYEYTILTKTHGATKNNLANKYADKTRAGLKAVFSPNNEHGIHLGYQARQHARDIAAGKVVETSVVNFLLKLDPSDSRAFMDELNKNGGLNAVKDKNMINIVNTISQTAKTRNQDDEPENEETT